METKKLKVAVCINGLIQQKAGVAAYVRQQFDKISEEHNIEFDFYCHFWKNDFPYPYIIDEEYLGIVTMPKEWDESVEQVIEALSPKQVIRTNYADMQDIYFLEGMTLGIDFNRTSLMKFIGKKIDRDFFYNLNPEDPAAEFDQWWRLHNDWLHFAFLTSQFFATSQALTCVANSNISYDAVLKWRYDQVLLPNDFDVNVIVDTLRNPHKGTLSTEWMAKWSKQGNNLITDTNQGKKLPLTTNIEDCWWVVNLETAGYLAANLASAYANVKKFRPTFCLEFDGQHVMFYYALRSLNIDIYLTGTITTFLIRDPSLLPPLDEFDAKIAVDEKLHAALFDKHRTISPHSELTMVTSRQKRQMYYAIKNFRFV